MSEQNFDPAKDGAKMSFSKDMSYGDYLNLEQILTAQHPLTSAHDEMLFIIQHQTSELWMKQAIHELEAIRTSLDTQDISPAFKMLSRVSRIFEQLNSAWDVLRTMTPADYSHFRSSLSNSSGFQSWQYRQIEYILGNRNPHLLKPHEHHAEITAILRNELEQPSLYEVVCGILFENLNWKLDLQFERQGRHIANPEITAAWREIYKDPMRYWQIYELGEKLVDIEDYFRRWRFNHVTTVERVIGFKRGTGGTSGVDYLKRMLATELFPELWQVRTEL